MPVILFGKVIQNYFTAIYGDKWRVDNSVDNSVDNTINGRKEG